MTQLDIALALIGATVLALIVVPCLYVILKRPPVSPRSLTGGKKCYGNPRPLRSTKTLKSSASMQPSPLRSTAM